MAIPEGPTPVVSLEEQIACVEREIRFRKHVYPRWVEAKKLLPAKASLELDRMQAVLSTLQALQTTRNPKLL